VSYDHFQFTVYYIRKTCQKIKVLEKTHTQTQIPNVLTIDFHNKSINEAKRNLLIAERTLIIAICYALVIRRRRKLPVLCPLKSEL